MRTLILLTVAMLLALGACTSQPLFPDNETNVSLNGTDNVTIPSNFTEVPAEEPVDEEPVDEEPVDMEPEGDYAAIVQGVAAAHLRNGGADLPGRSIRRSGGQRG